MRVLTSYIQDETGAVTVEFVTLFPLVIAFFLLFADVSVIYLTHSEMFNTARDLARRMSTGEISNTSEARIFAAEHLFLGERTYHLQTSFGGNRTATLSISIADAAFTGYFFSPILGRTLSASATVRRELLPAG